MTLETASGNAGPDGGKVPSPSPCRRRVIVSCGCGRSYTDSEWRALRPLGPILEPGYPTLELRNCVCGSTKGVYRDEYWWPCDERGSRL